MRDPSYDEVPSFDVDYPLDEEISPVDYYSPFEEEGYDFGTCQGCGRYGKLGRVCVRNGEECGEFL